MKARITNHRDITVAISGSLMAELTERFEEEKKEFPSLTIDQIIVSALRDYLQHKEVSFERGKELGYILRKKRLIKRLFGIAAMALSIMTMMPYSLSVDFCQ